MAYEQVIKRIIYQMKCYCGYIEIIDDKPPREKQCPECKKWSKFERIEWTGPDKFDKRAELNESI